MEERLLSPAEVLGVLEDFRIGARRPYGYAQRRARRAWGTLEDYLWAEEIRDLGTAWRVGLLLNKPDIVDRAASRVHRRIARATALEARR